MQITADEMKESMKRIYQRLDEVSPVDFDCGTLCNEVCCVYDEEDYSNDDLVLYLMPGEELMYEDSDSFELYQIKSRAANYPDSWEDKVFMVKCLTPPRCERNLRPIQCRTFPLIPHLTKEGDFHLVFDESEFPYECPLVHDNIKLNQDFIDVTYDVWMLLIKNPVVYDLVEMDSRRRNNKRIDFKIIK